MMTGTTDSKDETARHKPLEAPQGVLAFVRENPIGTLTLLVSVVTGALVCFTQLDAGLSDVRRILGGALAGGGAWLCVYVGRAMGE